MSCAVAVKEDFIHAISGFHKNIKILFHDSMDKTAQRAQWDNYPLREIYLV